MHESRSNSAPVYVNHGGIGFQSDASGALPIRPAYRFLPLRLVAVFDNKTLREISAPASGWDSEAVADELERERALVLSLAPVDAFLGTDWIGSTEV